MRISKKLYTTLIISVLAMSALMVTIPMASAINIPSITFMGMPWTTGPANFQVDVSGDGATAFGKVEVYWKTLATKLGEGYADSAGEYTIKVTIPEDVAGVHNVVVYDVLSSGTNYATYTITPSLMLFVSKALPGDSVMMMGSGFGKELAVQLYLGRAPGTGVTPVTGESVALAGTPLTGTFANGLVALRSVELTVDVTIEGEVNSVPVTGTGAVTVTDNGKGILAGSEDDIVVDDGIVTESGEVDVTIAGTINYETGVITLTATGEDSAGGTGEVENIVVTIDTPCAADYSYAEHVVTPSAGVTTSAKGSFTATIIVPAIPEVDFDEYRVIAIDTDGNLALNLVMPPYFPAFTIDYYITLTPASGPTGITTTITGRIKANTAYELRFNTVQIGTGTSGATGTFTGTYLIPAVLPTGLYDVDVVWEVTKSRTAVFTVTAPPQVTYAPTSAIAGTVVKISTVAGFPFSAGAKISLYLGTTLVNSTDMDASFGPTVATGPNAGSFTDLEFTVPTLTPGPYALKVVDEFGASTAAIYTFTVLPTPVTTVALNAASYYQGNALSFTFVSTDTILVDPVCTIRDPTGSIWWTDGWTTSVVGPITTVRYQDQIFGVEHAVLPADAPLGTWNWTITYTPSTSIATKVTGLFTVAAPPTLQTVINQLNANATTLLDAIESYCDDLTALLTALDGKVTSISGTVATVSTSMGTVQTTVSSLDSKITSVSSGMATVQTNLGAVQTSLSSLDAVVGSMYGDVVTIDTTLGTIEGTLMDMDGTLATIRTDIGTMKLDVASVKTDVDKSLPVSVDMLPVWIAVILSLIAAIAAIFAVVTIRQKIAG